MKNRLTLGFSLLLLIAFALVGLADHHKEKKAEPLKVLIIDGQNNHDWKSTTPVLRDIYGDEAKYSIEVTTTPPAKSPDGDWDSWRPDFSKYDVVVSNYNGEMWPGEVRAAFVEYVKSGGGFVVVHAANNAFPMWTEYNEMIGLGGWGGRTEKNGPYVYYKDGKLVRDESKGKGGGHGPQFEFVIKNRAAEHPVTKGMPDEWKHTKDELYDNLRGPAKNMTVLATADSGEKRTKRHEPMLMAIRYGKGRVFHTTLGHADYSMRCRGFYDTMKRGTEWAAKGEVMTEWSKDFPKPDATLPVAAK